MRRKMSKKVRTENSVQAYACVCSCGCSCVCNLIQGGASNLGINKVYASIKTEVDTKAING